MSTLDDVEALLRNWYPSLDMEQAEIAANSIDDGTKKQWVIMCSPRYVVLGGGGPTKPARMVFSDGGLYVFQVQVLLMPTMLNTILTPTSSCLDNMAQSYVACTIASM